MTPLFFCLLAFLLGVSAGLRALTPLAAVSLAAHFGRLALAGGPLAFFGSGVAAVLFSALALAELVGDKLPQIPSRKSPGPFAFRLFSGAICGAAVAAPAGAALFGAGLGALGALVGTLGGFRARALLAGGFGRDLPAALTEDAAALALAACVLLAQ